MPAKGWALDGSPLPPPLSIKVHAASLAFAGRPLFAELDVDIAGGLVTCILGPSGVGKSTLLRLVAGLESGAPGTRIEASDGAPLAGRADVIATPHVAGLTPPAIEHQALETVRQVAEIVAGRAPPGAVNEAQATRLPTMRR